MFNFDRAFNRVHTLASKSTTDITAILPSESAAVPELAPCPWPALTHLSAVRRKSSHT